MHLCICDVNILNCGHVDGFLGFSMKTQGMLLNRCKPFSVDSFSEKSRAFGGGFLPQMKADLLQNRPEGSGHKYLLSSANIY